MYKCVIPDPFMTRIIIRKDGHEIASLRGEHVAGQINIGHDVKMETVYNSITQEKTIILEV